MQGAVSDSVVNEFKTYEDYLDSQITPLDLYYLEDEDLARQVRWSPNQFCCYLTYCAQLVELGYRGSGETLKREEFEAKKKAIENARLSKMRNASRQLASANKVSKLFIFSRKKREARHNIGVGS